MTLHKKKRYIFIFIFKWLGTRHTHCGSLGTYIVKYTYNLRRIYTILLYKHTIGEYTEYVCIFFYVGTFIYNLEKVMIALHSARISLWKNIWNFFSQLFKLNPNYKRRRNAWMFKEVGKLVLSDSVIFVWSWSLATSRSCI